MLTQYLACSSAFLSTLFILLFSSLLSLFIPPLVQLHYWHFCQCAAQNAVSNISNQQFTLFLSSSSFTPFFLTPPFQTMAGVDRQCTAVINSPPPPLTSVVSCQALGRVVRGWMLRSNQYLCRFKWLPVSIWCPSSIFFYFSPLVELPGCCWEWRVNKWTLNGSLLLTSCCSARFPSSLPRWMSLRIICAKASIHTCNTDIYIFSGSYTKHKCMIDYGAAPPCLYAHHCYSESYARN